MCHTFLPKIQQVATRIQLLRVCYKDAEVKRIDGEIARERERKKGDPAANPRKKKKGGGQTTIQISDGIDC